MKTTAAKTSPFLLSAVVGLAVVALVGAALMLRGPDPIDGPQMAERPVMMPDGAALFVQKYEVRWPNGMPVTPQVPARWHCAPPQTAMRQRCPRRACPTLM